MRREAAILILLAAAAAPALAQTGWTMIGEKEIAPAVGSDAITFATPRPLRGFMLCVDRSPVRFRGITIRFQSGATREIAFRDRLSPGRCGRALSVRGRDGAVAAIGFNYDPESLGDGYAAVQAFGN